MHFKMSSGKWRPFCLGLNELRQLFIVLSLFCHCVLHRSDTCVARWLSWPNSQIPECNRSISHNAPFRTEMCTFLFWMEHCEIWNRCILGFVKLVYLLATQLFVPKLFQVDNKKIVKTLYWLPLWVGNSVHLMIRQKLNPIYISTS